MTPKRFKSGINKANTNFFPGADTGSNHNLVLTTIKLKLKTKHFTKSPCPRFDLEKLRDLKIPKVFQARVDGSFAALCVLDRCVDTLGNSLKEVLPSTAEEVLGTQRKKFQPLVTNEVLDYLLSVFVTHKASSLCLSLSLSLSLSPPPLWRLT